MQAVEELEMPIEATKTVRELAVELPNATRIFEQLGIDYCCGGERPLSAACAVANLDVDKVLSRLEQGLSAATQKAERDWSQESLAELIGHVNTAHHAYVRSESPRILALAAKVAGKHGGNHPELLRVQALFNDLANDLQTHLMKEEQILFPYVLRLEEAFLAGEPAPPAMFGTVANPVRMMMAEHDAAGGFLRELRSVTNDYAVPEDACISYRTLYQALSEFEADLHQHIHLENNILFPRAVAMEN